MAQPEVPMVAVDVMAISLIMGCQRVERLTEGQNIRQRDRKTARHFNKHTDLHTENQSYQNQFCLLSSNVFKIH